MDPPTAWNIDDKSDCLNVNSGGLRVDYAGKFIAVSMELYGYKYKIYSKFK